jgi:eukaryotic-like serine/threonine-protein kinase
MSPAIILTVADGCPTPQRYAFTKRAYCLVGRAEDCDIRFPMDALHSCVSRHHCLFTIEPPLIEVRDLGSLTGTYVNGRLIGKRFVSQQREEVDLHACTSCTLHEGDEVRIGPVVIVVGREGAVPELPRLRARPVGATMT